MFVSNHTYCYSIKISWFFFIYFLTFHRNSYWPFSTIQMINDIIFIDGFCVSVSSPYIRWTYNRVVGLTASLLRSWTVGIKYFIISLLCFLPPEYSILPVHITRLHEISWLLSLPVFFYINSWLHSLPRPQVIHLKSILFLYALPWLWEFSVFRDIPFIYPCISCNILCGMIVHLISIKFSGFTGIKTPYKFGKDKFQKRISRWGVRAIKMAHQIYSPKNVNIIKRLRLKNIKDKITPKNRMCDSDLHCSIRQQLVIWGYCNGYKLKLNKI